MRPIRILIVDGSIVARRLATDVLGDEPRLEVVGAAANREIAVSKADRLEPDLVVLDLEMPHAESVLETLRASRPNLPIVAFSTFGEDGESNAALARAQGATDFVQRPARSSDLQGLMAAVRTRMIPLILGLWGLVASPASVPSTAPDQPENGSTRPPARPAPLAGPRAPIEVIVVGVSTGGPDALSALVPALPPDLGVPILIVQHMPPTFTRSLAERLDRHCMLPVREGTHGAHLRAGEIWIAPGGQHMDVVPNVDGHQLRIHDAPPEHSCRPSVDVLFRSAAERFGRRCLAVVLTGMGQDGLEGAKTIHRAGGEVIAQDQATSVVWGMPGFVAQSGIASEILPLDHIAGAMLARTPRVVRDRTAGATA